MRARLIESAAAVAPEGTRTGIAAGKSFFARYLLYAPPPTHAHAHKHKHTHTHTHTRIGITVTSSTHTRTHVQSRLHKAAKKKVRPTVIFFSFFHTFFYKKQIPNTPTPTAVTGTIRRHPRPTWGGVRRRPPPAAPQAWCPAKIPRSLLREQVHVCLS